MEQDLANPHLAQSAWQLHYSLDQQYSGAGRIHREEIKEPLKATDTPNEIVALGNNYLRTLKSSGEKLTGNFVG